jgi:hypothetical protein
MRVAPKSAQTSSKEVEMFGAHHATPVFRHEDQWEDETTLRPRL